MKQYRTSSPSRKTAMDQSSPSDADSKRMVRKGIMIEKVTGIQQRNPELFQQLCDFFRLYNSFEKTSPSDFLLFLDGETDRLPKEIAEVLHRVGQLDKDNLIADLFGAIEAYYEQGTVKSVMTSIAPLMGATAAIANETNGQAVSNRVAEPADGEIDEAALHEELDEIFDRYPDLEFKQHPDGYFECNHPAGDSRTVSYYHGLRICELCISPVVHDGSVSTPCFVCQQPVGISDSFAYSNSCHGAGGVNLREGHDRRESDWRDQGDRRDRGEANKWSSLHDFGNVVFYHQQCEQNLIAEKPKCASCSDSAVFLYKYRVDAFGGRVFRKLLCQDCSIITIGSLYKYVNQHQEAFEKFQPVCVACEKPGYNLLRCKECLVQWYCSKECQRADWKVHKPYCKQLKRYKENNSVLEPEITEKHQGPTLSEKPSESAVPTSSTRVLPAPTDEWINNRRGAPETARLLVEPARIATATTDIWQLD